MDSFRKIGLLVLLIVSYSSLVFAQNRDWLEVNDFLYQLQNPNSKRIAATKFDLIVTSIALAGNSAPVSYTHLTLPTKA